MLVMSYTMYVQYVTINSFLSSDINPILCPVIELVPSVEHGHIYQRNPVFIK